jgi:hypothetical protein
MQKNTYIQDKLDDVRNQIMIAFKHLEHGVSFFNGIPVMEDFEEESMNQIIDEALKQSLTDYHNHIVEIIEKEFDENTWTEQDGIRYDTMLANRKLQKILSLLQDTNKDNV